VLGTKDRDETSGIVALGIEGVNQNDETVVTYTTNLLMEGSEA